jgi:hypothetical protein
MKAVKMIFLVGSFTVVTLGSIRAVPLDITYTGAGAGNYWGGSAYNDPGFLDSIPLVNYAPSINLAGVNSITMTWAAPAGYMYAVTPPPTIGGTFYFFAGYTGQASSLGSMTVSSFSINTVYGTAPLGGEAGLVSSDPNDWELYFEAIGSTRPGSAPFAFTSLTISADFSGTGADTTLDRTVPNSEIYFPGNFMGIFTGDFPLIGPGLNYEILPDPGPQLTLEPLPSGAAPDTASTLTLAGIGFTGLLVAGRKQKRLPVNG